MGKKQPQQEAPKKQGKIFEAFFSGIPYECTQESLKQFLGGDDGIFDIKLPRYQDTGRCRGYAHIKFDDEQAYNNALAKNGENLGSRYITIEPARGEKQADKQINIPVGCKCLFVKGLPYEIKQQQLKQQFSSCGIVTDVRMVRNSVNKKFKGFAYIDFKDANSLKKAVKKYHDKSFRGRRLFCDASVTSMKKGFKRRNPEDQKEEPDQE